jgi:hypothetical protein
VSAGEDETEILAFQVATNSKYDIIRYFMRMMLFRLFTSNLLLLLISISRLAAADVHGPRALLVGRIQDGKKGG